MTMAATYLKAKLAVRGEAIPEPMRVRIHRAISWLARAQQEEGDPDARFVFLWIAFNAAYARAFGFEDSSREQVRAFFAQLVAVDADKRLASLMLTQFSGPVRTLVANKYVFEPFWRALRDHDSSGHWEEQFQASGKAATRAVLDGRVDVVLGIVFDRLYVLRNQLVHGGATWNSRANRAQVKDGANIMSAVVPVFVELMLDQPDVDFGEILYPVV
ncbi:MAG: hypothetical protein IPH99_12290 [Xanthomonadales bacterium]|nr:hypothetical protein [Xanthomonadales bacterium]